MALTRFDAPIPGQSLTNTPGNVPWESPPEYADPIDALEMYIGKLADKEVLDDITDMLDLGIPISVVAGSMLSEGVMNGMHSVDIKLILKPVLELHIKTVADVIGVDYKMSMADYRDKDAEAKERRTKLLTAKLKERSSGFGSTLDKGEEILVETQRQMEEGDVTLRPEDVMQDKAELEATMEAPAEEEVEQEMLMGDETPKGLMARG